MNISKLITCAPIPIFSEANNSQDKLVKVCDFPNNYEITFCCIHFFWVTGILNVFLLWKTRSKECATQICHWSLIFLFHDNFIPNFCTWVNCHRERPLCSLKPNKVNRLSISEEFSLLLLIQVYLPLLSMRVVKPHLKLKTRYFTDCGLSALYLAVAWRKLFMYYSSYS